MSTPLPDIYLFKASPTVQNEVIDACYEILTSKVITKIKAAKFFAIMADETRDIATLEQVTNCIRFVCKNDDGKYIVREDFLNFVPSASTTGDALAKVIIKNLNEFGLDVAYLVGQGYDGASNMSGKFNGVQATIRNNYAPHALYIHCAAHSLNLAISVTGDVPAIRDCLSTMETIYNFFNTPKRSAVLQQTIDESDEAPRIKTLKRLNLTRWVAKYEAVNDFCALFQFVCTALDSMRAAEKDVKSLRNAMDFEFVISLNVIDLVYQLSLPLSREFQKINLDLKQVVDLAKDFCEELKKIRIEEDSFKKIFESSKTMADIVEIEVKYKRVTGRQQQRSNPSVQSTEDYFRVTVFYPFLDFYISDVQERFIKHENVLKGFAVLFMHDRAQIDKSAEDFLRTAEFYQTFLVVGLTAVLAELYMWKNYLIRKGDINPQNSFEALDNCPEENFTNINILLKILATLPVSTATAERTFSGLKRIKTIQRNMINEDRLNGLAALAMHRDIGITTDEVISELAKKPRRLDFLI